jgi:hypothetical protein
VDGLIYSFLKVKEIPDINPPPDNGTITVPSYGQSSAYSKPIVP